MNMKYKLLIIAGALGVTGAAAGGGLYLAYPVQVSTFAGLTRNYLLSWSAPPGTTTTELNAAYKAPDCCALACRRVIAERHRRRLAELQQNTDFGSLLAASEINTKNVGKLKVLCTYDVGEYTAFESGLIMVDNALIGTTEFDIFSLNPATCAENWRTHEDYPPSLLPANRGAAYLDGMLFRGTQDGRVLAYDFKTGKRIWETTIADPKLGELVPSAPIAWDGLVFVGNAGGDFKGGKGRMYALDAKTGKIVWEFFLVPKSRGRHGPRTARRDAARHVDLEKRARHTDQRRRNLDLLHARHENRAALRPRRQSGSRFRNRRARGREFLYRLGRRARRQDRGLQESFQACAEGLARLGRLQPAHPDSNDGRQAAHGGRAERRIPLWLRSRQQQRCSTAFRLPESRMSPKPFRPAQAVHFCPGAVGGAEWNSPAYDPQTNLILVGEVEWCDTATPKDVDELRSVKVGQPWAGMATLEPVQHVRHGFDKDTGRDGFTPSTPTPASGSGA